VGRQFGRSVDRSTAGPFEGTDGNVDIERVPFVEHPAVRAVPEVT
jgi:hypothetical protein